MRKIFFRCIICSLFFFATFSFFSCTSIRTVNYEIEKEKIENEFRILQISDFHSNDFGKEQEKLITKVKESNPNIIVITGDLFDHRMKEKKYFPNVEALLIGLKDLCPIFFVTGNHDFINLELEEKYSLLEKYGVKILHDEVVLLSREDGSIVIAGIHDPYFDLGQEIKRLMKDKKEKYRARLAELSKKTEEKILEIGKENIVFTLLLAHRPEYVKDYDQYSFDIILSGHAHGGQWRFPPLINGLYAPGQGMFPKYAGGKYTLKNEHGTIMIVSRGLSYQQPKLARIGNPPELVLIKVIKETEKSQGKRKVLKK